MTHVRQAIWSAVVALALASACEGDDDDVQSDGSPSTGGSLGSDTGGTKNKTDAGEGGERTVGPKGGTGGAAGEAGAAGNSGAAGEGGSASVARPYANVVAVAASGDDGAFTFSVSIESADLDCTQFADWWEVLGEDGTLVYRRILEHSHTDENGTTDTGAPGNTFTRSGGPIPVAPGEVVLVRAHMSRGGYEGMVMRGSVNDGFADAPEIHADFAAGVEDDAPQPTSCAF